MSTVRKLSTRRGDSPALASLKGILYMVDGAKGTPNASVMKQIREATINAMEVLRIPDPEVQRLATTALLLIEATQIVSKKVFGVDRERVIITDPQAFDLAIMRLHRMNRAAA